MANGRLRRGLTMAIHRYSPHARVPLSSWAWGGSSMQLRRLIAAALVTTSVTTAMVIARSNTASAAPALPLGFVLTDLSTGQAKYDLTDFAYLPDGSMLTTGKQGNVAWVSPTGEATSIAQIPVNSRHDVGLVSVAIDRDYASNHRIYL